MSSLILEGDGYGMNWIEGTHSWGEIFCPKPLQTEYISEKNGDLITERFIFKNNTGKTVVNSAGQIGIYATFNDNYDSAQVCLTQRCHTHIFCGGDVSYVMALRMGGEPPHLGLCVTKGGLYGYSVERNPALQSNDRGDFILHPEYFVLAPGEEYVLEWVLFPHGGEGDFYEKLASFGRYIDIKADRYVLFEGEDCKVTLTPSFDFDPSEISVAVGEEKIKHVCEGGKVYFNLPTDKTGQVRADIEISGIKTFAKFYVSPSAENLTRARRSFIAKNQQMRKDGDMLCGAYLTYDNETGSLVVGDYDSNAARERTGMGAMIALSLRLFPEDGGEIKESLLKYEEYIRREIFDTETGIVYNDFGRDNEWNRLYNYPWISIFYLEMYKTFGDEKYLSYAPLPLYSYYEQGGENFYAIGIPAKELVSELEKAGFTGDAEKLKKLFLSHADILCLRGKDYPAHEVKYEQSIVAPAARMLCDAFSLSGDEKYLRAAAEQIEVLSLFASHFPDFHLYETAIRHWDGFWFGKNKLYGDTFPHYWSALSGIAYYEYAGVSGKEEYKNRAVDSLRGVLPTFFPDGSASCAYVFPEYVNGVRAAKFDPYANDQDFGLYYYLKYLTEER